MNELSVCQRACIEAGKVALSYLSKEKELGVRVKSGVGDIVTEADFECERVVKKVILSEFPNHAFFGEEFGLEGDSDFVWVVDPIDGTTNFSHGVDYFAHSIALVKNGEIFCGCVYNPVQKKLYSAQLGKGATLNNKRISVSKVDSLSSSLLISGFSSVASDTGLLDKTFNSILSLRGKCQDVRRFGSASLDLCLVAEGVCDGFFEYSLNPWDVAAGVLIVREAGGRVTDINGVEASIYSKHFLASNGLLHDSLIGHLEGV